MVRFSKKLISMVLGISLLIAVALNTVFDWISLGHVTSNIPASREEFEQKMDRDLLKFFSARAVVEQEIFEVTDFQEAADIKDDPSIVQKIFPAPLVDGIVKRAAGK